MTKYKNKILLTLLFIITLLLLNNKVFAGYEDTNFGEINPAVFTAIENTSQYQTGEYFYIVGRNDTSYYKVCLIKKDPDLKLYVSSTSGSTFKVRGNKSCYLIECKCNADGSGFSVWKTTSSATGDFYFYQYNVSNFLFYSQETIYLDSTIDDSKLFFQLPPPIVEEPEIPEEIPEPLTPFQEAMKEVEMKPTLAEVVAILPVILSVLVSLIALRKGLKTLFIFLRKS